MCDFHFVYMGYGKFGHITHKSANEHVNTNTVQTSIRSTAQKVVTSEPSDRTPISRTHHGQHPPQTISAHIDYCNLNKGLDRPAVKSPTKGKKRRSTSELTLREPSVSRLASQAHITSEKQQDPPAIISPGQIIGTVVKSEDIKVESEKDEADRYRQILGECKKRKTTASNDPTLDLPVPTPVLYTHAHGHVCSRRECNPIQLSKQGIVKPSRPPTEHSHISNIPCDKMTNPVTKSSNTNESNISTETPTTANVNVNEETNKSMNTYESSDGNLPSTSTDTATTASRNDGVTKSTNTMEIASNATQATSDTGSKSMNANTSEADNLHLEEITAAKNNEHEAADGLLMLQQLAEMDQPDPNDDQLPLFPLAQETATLEDQTMGTTVPPAPSKSTEADNSDDTIIYDPSDYLKNALPEKPPPPKGILTITEVGIRSRPSTSSDPVGPVTSEGKLRCDYCKRSFNTRSEKLQHINRRHADRAKENNSKNTKEKTDTQPRKSSQTKGMKSTNTKDPNRTDNKVNTKKSPVRSKPKPNCGRKDKTNRNTKSNNKSNNKRQRQNRKTEKRSDNTRIRRYRCQSCSREFEMQSELNKHYKKRHPPVKCHICGKLCATPNTLSRHMYKHKDRPHKCGYCVQSFAFKSELDGHLITHQGEPGFFCENCDKTFM